jgi:LmbE family N-acetylglucosaminyl deacetylase
MTDKVSLLAVFAHPGDESWGPGATLAMYARQGVEVTLICATKGEASPWSPDSLESLQEPAEHRLWELAAACKALGILRWTVLGYPDGSLIGTAGRELEKDIVMWIRELQPNAVITHYPEGTKGHPDHDTVSRATTRAYLGSGRAKRYLRQLKAGLTPWSPRDLYYVLPPDVQISAHGSDSLSVCMPDVSRFVRAKARALRCHASQEPCWRGLIKTLQTSQTWVEPLYLAHTNLSIEPSTREELVQTGVASSK